MNYKGFMTAAILSATVISVASGAEIYKWTDENGSVHYTDKPISEQAEHMAIRSRPTDNDQVQAQVQARLEKAMTAAEADAAAALANPQPTKEELREQARERAARCDTYKERLTNFVQARHLYREDDDGGRVYLDETEMQAARDRVQKQVEENCTS